MLPATERGKDIVGAWQWILVHFELRIDCHLVVSTDADSAVLLGYWDNRRGPVTVRNFRQNSFLFQAVKFKTDSVTQRIGQRPCLQKLCSSTIAEREMSATGLQMTRVRAEHSSLT